jgi:hypothetical protein
VMWRASPAMKNRGAGREARQTQMGRPTVRGPVARCWLVALAGLWLGQAQLEPVVAQNPPAWVGPVAISAPGEHGWGPVLATDTAGTVHVLWYGRSVAREDETTVLFYVRYALGSWSAPNDVLGSPGGENAQDPCAVVDGAGRLHAFWRAPFGGPFGPLYQSWAPVQHATSARAWQSPRAVAEGTFGCDVQADMADRLHLVYANVTQGEGICHMLSEDDGATWSPRTCLPHAATVRLEESEIRPRLAIDSRGTLHLVWVLADYSALSRLSYSGRAVFYARSTDGGATWTDALSIQEVDSRDPTYEGRQPESANVAVDRDDRVHVVWIGKDDMYRYHTWSADGGDSWTPPQVAISSGGYNGSQGIAIDKDGVVHLAWASLRGLEYTRWLGSGWDRPTLFEGTRGAHWVDAEVALGNELHVVWQDHGGQPDASSPGKILHAMLRTGAQADAPLPVPTVLMARTPQPTETAIWTGAAVAEPTEAMPVVRVEPPAEDPKTGALLLVPVVPAAVLVLVVVLVRIRRS